VRTGTALALALAAAAPLGARADQRVAVMPFEESSRVPVAEELSRAFSARLVARHHALVAPAAVEAFLERERIRWVDSLPPEALDRLLAETGATRVLFGHVLAASERPLFVAVKARLVGPGGRPFWSDVAIVREERGGGVLTPRKVATLPEAIAEAARRLADGVPDGRGAGTARPGGAGGLLLSRGGPVAYRARGAGRVGASVAVLPPTNYSDDPRATRVVAELLAVRAGAEHGVPLIEPDALRRAALGADLRLGRRLDADDLKRLAPAVGTRLFLRTTVLAFEPAVASPVGDARVALEMTLLDVDTGRILWTAIDDRRATDYGALFRQAPLRDVVSLADRVVDELVGTLWN
jgi:TolB-like protein